jgi:hypothetical protein
MYQELRVENLLRQFAIMRDQAKRDILSQLADRLVTGLVWDPQVHGHELTSMTTNFNPYL